jgi:hypothetical protein
VNRWLCPTLAAFVTLSLTGCEPGLEAPGIQEATASRQEDDRVSIAVTLSCDVVHGLPRGDGECDADGDRVCVSAQWYEATDTAFESPIATAESCQKVETIIGAQLSLVSPEPIPREPDLNILVRADVRVGSLVLANP